VEVIHRDDPKARENMKKMARSQSVKVTEMLKLPTKVERSISASEVEVQEMTGEDSDKPTILPILRVGGHSGTKEQRRKDKEKEDKEKCNGSAISSTGLICYSDLLQMLTCPSCSCMVSTPVSQCRKGHLYCKNCKTNSCRICKQTFVDAPNLALEKILTLIALPCKYGPQGCPSSVFLPSRLQHETVCQFRPVNCQFVNQGCKQVFSVKDMLWHHKMCSYAHYPHKNVLPNMPGRKKCSSSSDCNQGENGTAADAAQDDLADSDNREKCNGEISADSEGK